MDEPSSKVYDFESIISENNLCQSWVVRNRNTGERCFIKTPIRDDPSDLDSTRSVLLESFRHQQPLRTSKIVRARAKHVDNGCLFIEYPFLDRSIWKVVQSSLFWRHFPGILCQICLVIDYLHHLGLVHCDLKLGNFLVNITGKEPEVLLVDFDFLCPTNVSPKGRVFGTPEYIAPEIVANDRVVIQSDNYSLGVELGNTLEALTDTLRDSEGISAEVVSGLRRFTEQLTHRNYLQRPRFLLDVLYKYGLIDADRFSSTQKTLLAMLMLSRYVGLSREGLRQPKELKKFLRDKCKILGLHDDLIDMLAAAYSQSKAGAMDVFRQLIERATVKRQADYWHLALGNNDLVKVYSSLEKLAHSNRPGTAPAACEEDEAPFRVLHRAREIRDNQHPERAYIKLLALLDRICEDRSERSTAAMIPVLSELGGLASTLNRLEEADRHLSRLLAIQERQTCSNAFLLRALIKVNSNAGDHDRVEELISRGEQEVAESHNCRLELDLTRCTAWLTIARGEYVRAQSLLSSLLESATRQEFHDLIWIILYTIGTMHMRQGEFGSAEDYFERALEAAEDRGFLHQAMPVLSTLSWIHCEVAEYEQATRFAKAAIRVGADAENMIALPHVTSSLAWAYGRLGDVPKAQHWLQRYLSEALTIGASDCLFQYFEMDGFLRLNRGDVASALESHYRCLEMADSGVSCGNVGKVYYNLAEAALFQGDLDAFDSHLVSAREALAQTGDDSGLAELDLFAVLKDIYYGKTDGTQDLLSVTETLARRSCRYYAMVSVYHLLLGDSGDTRAAIVKLAEPLTEFTSNSKVPLFQATGYLLGDVKNDQATGTADVTAWKEAFRLLHGSGAMFLAMLTGIKIAEIYIGDHKSKHGLKFLRQSLHLAENLVNKPMVRRIKDRLAAVSASRDNQADAVQSFHQISSILKEFKEYKESLHELVRFAVDQTGAERGVLLLKRRESNDFFVGAAVNCDDESLSDIVDFSRSVPATASEDIAPLLIENALTDKRTRKYQSVMYHNILSVACFPLGDEDSMLGALYLDHHTIPALFDRQDIAYMQSIANFISVALKTLKEYQGLNLTNVQLLQDLKKQGDPHAFITRDSALIKLFERLPQIAGTNAPILITGESGTGKEILCHMIHSLSLRADMPLVKLNCAAIASTLIESELFGMASRTATGVAARNGKFAAADGGTLYLDEIGDMPLETQAKILRVVEYQQFEKVGSNRPIYTDIRFIYATNKDLQQMVDERKFRQDLLYRINTITIEIPPLRSRPDDVVLLVEEFLGMLCVGRKPPRFTSDAMDTLIGYRWPGNVRELKNFVERCCILYPGVRVDANMLPPEMLDQLSADPQNKAVSELVEQSRIEQALVEANWNESRAARTLEIPLTTLRRRIKKYGIRKKM